MYYLLETTIITYAWIHSPAPHAMSRSGHLRPHKTCVVCALLGSLLHRAGPEPVKIPRSVWKVMDLQAKLIFKAFLFERSHAFVLERLGRSAATLTPSGSLLVLFHGCFCKWGSDPQEVGRIPRRWVGSPGGGSDPQKVGRSAGGGSDPQMDQMNPISSYS